MKQGNINVIAQRNPTKTRAVTKQFFSQFLNPKPWTTLNTTIMGAVETL
jgi:hypothetical protein